MKNIFLLVLMTIIFASSAYAEVEITNHQFGSMKVMVIDWTAETNGTFTVAETNAINGTVGWVETKPGSTAPTALYDITLTNSDGLDIMGGKLADRSATLAEGSAPYDTVGAIYLTTPVRGPLDITITNNSVNSATGTISIFFWVY